MTPEIIKALSKMGEIGALAALIYAVGYSIKLILESINTIITNINKSKK